MKENKIKVLIIILLIILLVVLVGAYIKDTNPNTNISSNQTSEEIEVIRESNGAKLEYTDEELSGEVSDYTAKITLSDENIEVEGKGVTKNENTLSITSAGSYYITGSISDGNIVIEAGKEDDVTLVLDNASITSLDTAPINGIKAKKLTITLLADSVNTITDSSSYTKFTDTENEEPDSAIFTKTDLVINGTGKLIVNANYADGIASKDGLKIINSNIEINSQDDAIRGKDYVAINGAEIDITAKGDGIKSTNADDENLGYVVIQEANINITAESDGIQGETEITVISGDITVTSTDDSIHSNKIVIINGGEMKLSSGDDGIHADNNIIINDGKIGIVKCYEGIESSYIEINDGEISLVASDDGINISGGNDNSGFGGMPGGDNFSQNSDSNRKLVINGGTVNVYAKGDGLDSNGAININGGNITVAGANTGGNGPLDYDSECIVAGGSIVIYGSLGMWQNPSNNSTQYSIAYQVSGNADDEISIKDSSGNEIISFKTQMAYGAIVISDSELKKGEAYTLYKNGEEIGSVTVSDIVSTYGSFSGNGGMNMMEHNGRGQRGDF